MCYNIIFSLFNIDSESAILSRRTKCKIVEMHVYIMWMFVKTFQMLISTVWVRWVWLQVGHIWPLNDTHNQIGRVHYSYQWFFQNNSVQTLDRGIVYMYSFWQQKTSQPTYKFTNNKMPSLYSLETRRWHWIPRWQGSVPRHMVPVLWQKSTGKRWCHLFSKQHQLSTSCIFC